MGWSNTQNSCIPKRSEAPGIDGASYIRDAAFYSLVEDDPKVKDLVKQQLLAQASQPGLDFSNTDRWCRGYSSLNDITPGFLIANWMTKLLFAYDYVKDGFTEEESIVMNKWFLDAAHYFLHIGTVGLRYAFEDWINENYELRGESLNEDNVKPKYLDDPNPPRVPNTIFNNRRGCSMRFAFLVGVMQNDTGLINVGKRWVKDIIKYQMYADGTVAEFYRGNEAHPNHAICYGSYVINQTVTMADALARKGDLSLYQYTTTDGVFGSAGNPGSPKSIKLGIQALGKYLDGTFQRYVAPGLDPFLRIDGVGGTRSNPNRKSGYDCGSLIANLYYHDDYIKSMYLRDGINMPSYDKNFYGAEARNAGMGDFGIFPDVFFMFAQTEGLVDPYGKGVNFKNND